MKKLPVLLAVCTIICTSILASKETKANKVVYGYQWFHYNGGDKSDPSSYSWISSEEFCPASFGDLCEIYVQTGSSSTEIDASSLSELASESQDFTDQGAHLHGTVRLKIVN